MPKAPTCPRCSTPREMTQKFVPGNEGRKGRYWYKCPVCGTEGDKDIIKEIANERR